MAWGAPASRGVDDWVDRLRRNDPTMVSLNVLRGRRFGHEEVAVLCTALQQNTTLTELNSSGRLMAPETAALVGDLLAQTQSLTSLSLGDATFADAGVLALAEGLAKNTTLKTLDLERKGIGADGAAALGKALEAQSCLQHLLLARNALSSSGAAALLQHTMKGLQTLDVEECAIDEQGAAFLGEYLSRPGHQLAVLRLGGNPLGPGGAARLAGQGLPPSLTALHAAGTDMGDEGAAAIVQHLPASRLTHLDLAGNGMGVSGARALAAALAEQGCPLQTLVLRGNRVGAEGAASLGEALRSNAELRVLELGSNQLGSTGIAEALLRAPALQRLSLFDNPLGDEGAKRVASALSAGPAAGFPSQLRELDLSGCGIGSSGMAAVFQAVGRETTPQLQCLVVGANPATDGDSWEEAVGELRSQMPGLDVLWKAQDQGSLGAA